MASVRERAGARGTTYAVLYREDRRQKSETFDTQREAERFAKAVDLLGGTKAKLTMLAQENGDTLTVAELAEKWLEWKRHTGVTPRTIKDAERDLANYVVKAFGTRLASTIDESDVQAWVDGLARTGLAAKTIGDRHALLGGIFRWGKAKSRRLVDHDPTTETELPKARRKSVRGVSLPELHAIVKAAYDPDYEGPAGAVNGRKPGYDSDAGDLIVFLAGTGWRWSEAAALTVAGVEEDGVNVWAAVQRVFRRGEHGETYVAEREAKSVAGQRRVNLPHAAAAVVRRRIVGKKPSDLVFTQPNGKRWHQTNFLNRTWTRILDRAGIDRDPRPTPHALRHTHVALLDRAKVSPAKMQRRIGHENIQTTLNVYGGMIDNELTAAELAALDTMLSPALAATEIVAGQVVVELT
jgi:integrase